ncbi:hypothetical protein RND81_06G153700 [Saponaria officinalis]|uniref:Protein kinase domain-containing protein n=1 Tax=Saponaria officinalis TaxID=3572 RepID=A0AAW1K6H3_SAPOF
MKTNSATNKLKLVYSFNGKFRRQSPENKLRYTGGETRMVSLDPTTLNYLNLRSVISERVKSDVFKLKYRVPSTESGGDGGGDELPLVVVASDEDVTCMIEEFEAYYYREKCSNNFFRIWVYVCNDDNDEFFGSFSEKSGDFGCGFRVLGRNSLSSLEGSNYNHNHNRSHNHKKSSGNEKDCLRKLVLKQQLMLARQRDQIQGYLDERLSPNYMVQSCNNHQPLINLGNDMGEECQNLMIMDKSDELMRNCHGGSNNTPANAAISMNLSSYDSSLPSLEVAELSYISPKVSEEKGIIQVVAETGGFDRNSKDFVEEIRANLDLSCSLQQVKQDCTSASTDVDEKAVIRTNLKYSNMSIGVLSDLAAFYTQLATRELQTIKYTDLEYMTELGSGNYGTVYHAKWKGSDVAVKKLKQICFDGEVKEDNRVVADFWKEAHLLSHLHHPNIVAFYGVVSDEPITNFALVTEYMVNGSLKQVLRRKDRTIDRRKRVIIAMDAACGMEYLHEKNIVHFDLKSHNFLVNMRDPYRPVCKIGDLGLSKVKQRTMVSGGVRGTIPWMAPELLNASSTLVSQKVDVYSFGIVMWELLTGEEPYADMSSAEIIAGTIKGTLRPEIPSWCDPTWRSPMERCWSSDPDSRPHFSEIAKHLRDMSTSMNIK